MRLNVQMKMLRRLFRAVFWTAVLLFIAFNGLVAYHAYNFTHYDPTAPDNLQAEGMNQERKIRAAIQGLKLPRPQNSSFPSDAFDEVVLKGPNGNVHCWWVPVEGAEETVLLFHGYGASKSSMVDRAGAFRRMGYNTMLVDFTGSGNSDGSSTTVGFREAAEVQAAMDWVKENHTGKIHLFGSSMGAAAILKAVHDGASPASILIECPFGSMLQTIRNRCEIVGVPSFPVAHLLTFWGGAILHFNAFEHNPQEYAKSVRCPTLLMWGEADNRVIRAETDAIYAGLAGPKKLVTFPDVGHENYLQADGDRWKEVVSDFLKNGVEKLAVDE
jgi:pimeloyl-ACP methyl ester carboxylesterase